MILKRISISTHKLMTAVFSEVEANLFSYLEKVGLEQLKGIVHFHKSHESELDEQFKTRLGVFQKPLPFIELLQRVTEDIEKPIPKISISSILFMRAIDYVLSKPESMEFFFDQYHDVFEDIRTYFVEEANRRMYIKNGDLFTFLENYTIDYNQLDKVELNIFALAQLLLADCLGLAQLEAKNKKDTQKILSIIDYTKQKIKKKQAKLTLQDTSFNSLIDLLINCIETFQTYSTIFLNVNIYGVAEDELSEIIIKFFKKELFLKKETLDGDIQADYLAMVKSFQQGFMGLQKTELYEQLDYYSQQLGKLDQKIKDLYQQSTVLINLNGNSVTCVLNSCKTLYLSIIKNASESLQLADQGALKDLFRLNYETLHDFATDPSRFKTIKEKVKNTKKIADKKAKAEREAAEKAELEAAQKAELEAAQKAELEEARKAAEEAASHPQLMEPITGPTQKPVNPPSKSPSLTPSKLRLTPSTQIDMVTLMKKLTPFKDHYIDGDLEQVLVSILDNERYLKQGVQFEMVMAALLLAESRAHKKPFLFQLECLDDQQIIKMLKSVKGFEGVLEQYNHDTTAKFLMIDKGRAIEIGADLVIYTPEKVHTFQAKMRRETDPDNERYKRDLIQAVVEAANQFLGYTAKGGRFGSTDLPEIPFFHKKSDFRNNCIVLGLDCREETLGDLIEDMEWLKTALKGSHGGYAYSDHVDTVCLIWNNKIIKRVKVPQLLGLDE